MLIFSFSAPSFARSICAAYGPDFTLVEGTHSCIRIGGRLRVHFSEGAQDDVFPGRQIGASAVAPMLHSDAADDPPTHVRVDAVDTSYR